MQKLGAIKKPLHHRHQAI